MKKPASNGPTWSEYVSAHQRIAGRAAGRVPGIPFSEDELTGELSDQAVLHAWRGAKRRPVLTLVRS